MKIYSMDELKRYVNDRPYIMLLERIGDMGHAESCGAPVVGRITINDENTLVFVYRDRDSQEMTSIEFPGLEWSSVINDETGNIVLERKMPHKGFSTHYTWYEA